MEPPRAVLVTGRPWLYAIAPVDHDPRRPKVACVDTLGSAHLAAGPSSRPEGFNLDSTYKTCGLECPVHRSGGQIQGCRGKWNPVPISPWRPLTWLVLQQRPVLVTKPRCPARPPKPRTACVSPLFAGAADEERRRRRGAVSRGSLASGHQVRLQELRKLVGVLL